MKINPALSALGLWQASSEPIWSGIFPFGEDPDPAVVKAIRVFAPNYVPLWVTKAYVSPAGTEHVYGYHAFGLHTFDPESSEEDDAIGGEPVTVLRPTHGWPARFSGGRITSPYILSIKWEEGSWQDRCNVPEIPIPYDMRAEWWMKRTWHRIQKEKVGKLGNAEKNRVLAMRAAADRELQGVHTDIKLANRDDRYQLLRESGKATSSTAVAPSKQPLEVNA